MTNKASLLLLRGWMRDQRHWETFPEVLDAGLRCAGLDFDILHHDLPGNGLRYRESTPRSIQAITNDLRQQVTQQPLIIIGLSMGGMIAAEWTIQSPSQVKGICLINSSMRPYGRPWQRLRPSNWSSIAHRSLKGAEARESLIMSLTLGKDNQTADRLQRWLSWSLQTPVSLTNVAAQLFAAASYRYPGMEGPQLPCLLLSGNEDKIVNPVCSELLAKAWQCPLHSHSSAGHDLPVEAPEWTAEKIVQWLQGIRLP